MVNSPYFPVIEFKMLRWSVKYGVCAQSAVAFAVYGSLSAGSFGDLKKAHLMGTVADKLSQRPEFYNVRARISMTINGYCFHWTCSVRTLLKPLLDGYEVGMTLGDLENTFFCAYIYMKMSICAGRPLNLVQSDMLDFTAQMKVYAQETIYQMSLPHWQFVACMTDTSAPHPSVLSGEIMDYDKMIKHTAETKQVYVLDNIRYNQMQLAFYLGDYKLAWKMVEQSKDFGKTNNSHVTIWKRAFFIGMIAFCLGRRSPNRTERGMWKRKAKNEMSRLKKWATDGNVNCVHLLLLLDAEEKAFDEQNYQQSGDMALPLFQKAITMATRSGFIHDAALAAERTAEYLRGLAAFDIECDNSRDARVCDYIQLAINSYTEWGGMAKVDQLKKNWSSWNLTPAPMAT